VIVQGRTAQHSV